jgi:hypothetical protein
MASEETDDDADSETKPPRARRCLSRRLWDLGKSWRETLVPLVWFWRGGVLIVLVLGFFVAWFTPDFYTRLITVGVLLGLGLLLVLDLFASLFNLPLVAFYLTLWVFLSLTSLLDLVFYGRHLRARPNRIALNVLLANLSLLGLFALAWWLVQ